MKLIIQIPCFNEEETLRETLNDLPKEVPGFNTVEVLVVDDGSTDQTVAVARECGVRHIISHPHNLGLARAFITGIEACIARGADVIVNTDADNQYDASGIPALVGPVLQGEADLVIGARPIAHMENFSFAKKVLQGLGSWVVRVASGTSVEDAPSGFRAMSRDLAMQLHVFNRYTYTLETVIQAGREGMAVKSVPVQVNGETRPSRLVRSVGGYVWKSAQTILRIFSIYNPIRVFGAMAAVSFLSGLALGFRFLVFFLMGEGDGHVQSVILAVFLMGAGILFATIGLLADLIAVNRKLAEKALYRLHLLETRLREQKKNSASGENDQ